MSPRLCAPQEYNAALAAEDYGEAARLRDAGGLGLAGWWNAHSEAEPCGHLLRVAPDFGRLSGLMYTSRDLAELKAWRLIEPLSGILTRCQATCCMSRLMMGAWAGSCTPCARPGTSPRRARPHQSRHCF